MIKVDKYAEGTVPIVYICILTNETYKMKRLLPIIAALCAFVSCSKTNPGKLEINDRGYFETQGVNVLVYSNRYQGVFCDEKTAGVEIIQRGVRIATGGGVRLMNTPEQWDIYSVS